MELYSLLARHYDELFPLYPAVVDFVRSARPEGAVLDVGCATGSLGLSLLEKGYGVTGVDLDQAMVAIARSRTRRHRTHPGQAEFLEADMLRLDERFSAGRFDIVTCFGNTLVHLPDPEAVLRFFSQARGLLAPSGVLLFQVLNYQYIRRAAVRLLPVLETPALVFRREYRDRPDGRLDFSVSLLERASGVLMSDTVPLQPLEKDELDRLLKRAGFPDRRYCGGFDRRPFDPQGLVLVVEAR